MWKRDRETFQTLRTGYGPPPTPVKRPSAPRRPPGVARNSGLPPMTALTEEQELTRGRANYAPQSPRGRSPSKISSCHANRPPCWVVQLSHALPASLAAEEFPALKLTTACHRTGPAPPRPAWTGAGHAPERTSRAGRTSGQASLRLGRRAARTRTASGPPLLRILSDYLHNPAPLARFAQQAWRRPLRRGMDLLENEVSAARERSISRKQGK